MNNNLSKKLYLVQLAVLPVIAYVIFALYRFYNPSPVYVDIGAEITLFGYIAIMISIYLMALYGWRKILLDGLPDSNKKLAVLFLVPIVVVLIQFILSQSSIVFYLFEISFIQLVSIVFARYFFEEYAFGKNGNKRMGIIIPETRKQGYKIFMYIYAFVFVVTAYLPIVKIIQSPKLREYLYMPDGIFFWMLVISFFLAVIYNSKIVFSNFKKTTLKKYSDQKAT